jgi:4-amino-4-deoxy-L-arabinose transferase-like glycosyltransferase
MAGLAFLPHLGIENDEAIFANAFYKPGGSEEYVYTLGHSRLPLMLMNYLGTLKSWLYRPVFLLLGARVETLRIPVLLAGAASIWLFYRLMRRVAGERAALIGCGLLSADAIYLLATCFDWGPVAFQHLLVVGGALALARFWQDRNELALAAGFFLFGLALWDKAVAIWLLSGLGIAAVVTMPRQIFDRMTARRLAVAVLALALGAMPLIAYNVRSGLGTFRGTATFDANDIPGKARAFRGTLSGSVLFGWLTAENWQTQSPHAPRGWLQRASTAIAQGMGNPRHSFLFYAFCAALLLTPLAWGAGLRAIVFALVAMAVAWCQMAFTAGAGGAAHHVILLWPLPQMVIGISFAAASRRLGRAGIPVLAFILVVLMGSGLAVMNEYYAQAVRNGGAVAWNDAIFPLSDYMKGATSHSVFCLDWGFLDTLRMLSNGKLPVRVGSDQISKPELSLEDHRQLNEMISEPDNVFVAHTKDFEFGRGLSARLIQYAGNAGFHRETLAVISDSFGRPVFEVYRFAGPPQISKLR